MNREILEKLGFTKEMQLVENRQCPLCEATIDVNSFKDELSLKEFIISGMCQQCQDKIFAEPEE
jgi:C4-type Zn-finger protein